ncbi:amino acid adenylation domain-containing protein [Myxosarcina sp. GI1(2024)]
MDNFSEQIAALSPEQRMIFEKRRKQNRVSKVRTQEISEIKITKRQDYSELPLSFAQQRLWFFQQLNPDNSAYNVFNALRLEGQINIALLEKVFTEIVRRHESLRTTFTTNSQGLPIQIIAPSQPFKILIEDLQGVPEQEKEVQRLAIEEAQKPFDLTKPLLRITLLKLAETDRVLLLTMHHIISDRWSLGIFVREMKVLYEALSKQSGFYEKSRQTSLPELPIQYADWAVWQRQYLQGKVLEVQTNYWKNQLANLPILKLPTDRPRPAIATYRGAKQSFELSKTLSDALKSLSVNKGVTLFTLLLTAFKVLLHKYTNQDDLVVGTSIANRNRVETEGLIGFLVNTFVLHTDLSGNPTFTQLLNRVRETTLKAYEHQDLPFDKLVDILKPERDLSELVPLFQVKFDLQLAHVEPVEFSDLTVSPLSFDNGTAKYELRFNLSESDKGISGLVEYSIDIFDNSTIARMVEHYRNLLEAIVANPQQRLSELSLLTESEQQQLLVEWNDTDAEYPQDQCIHQLFEAQVEKTPDAIAVVFEEEALTYSKLNARANQLAHYLQQLGVKSKIRVGICVERSMEMVIGLLAILKLGSAYVPLEPSYPQERLSYMLEDSQPGILLTQKNLLENLPNHKIRVICIDSDWEKIALESVANPTFNLKIDNLAYIIYTSGSTGKPKGVAVEHQQLFNYINAIEDRLNLSVSTRFAIVSTFAADLGNTVIFPSLCNGGCLHVVSSEYASDPEILADYFHRHSIDCLKIVPSHLSALLTSSHAEKILPKRRLILGGEACPWKLIEQIQKLAPKCSIFNHYGPTEATVGVLTYPIKLDQTINCSGTVPLGRPIANTQIYILDSFLQPVPIGVPGELHIGGAGVARCYLNQADLTNEKFISNPFVDTEEIDFGQRLYKTGDLARYLPDGNIELIGRIDNQVKLRGFRIELGEIEAAIARHPAVRETVVVVQEESADSRNLVAYVVAQNEQTPTISELRSFLESKLPSYMVPAAFVTLETLPLTPNGKVDRKALPAPSILRTEADFVPASTPIENLLAGIWAEILNLEKVGINHNFFELGGHSLIATRVISQIRQVFETELPLRSLFERPTIAGLAQEIEQAIKSDSGIKVTKIEPISRTEKLPLSFAQQRLWFLAQLEPDSPFYNRPAAVRLQGQLNLNALEQSFNRIVARHETLRTSFQTTEGEARAVIDSVETFTIPLIDLSSLAASEKPTQIQQQIETEARHPFDISSERLIRIKFLRLEAQEHIVLLSMHHIISDGWSIGVLVRELASLYRAFSQGQPSPLSELPIQYVDFAAWQRQWLQGEVLETQKAYWLKQLENAPKVLELPTDHPRPAVQTFRGAKYSFNLSPELSTALNKLSQQQGSTLFMTLLAGFQTLLWRYTAQSDIVVGSPIANRNRAEIEGLIGFFVNTLVLRTNLAGNPSFIELLQRVRETTLGAYAHQDLPFELLVEQLQPERDLSHTPLFQVMFILQNAPMSELELPGLTLTPVKSESETAKFDLSLYMSETESGLKGNFEYNTDLFERATIARMVGHLETLLEAIVANPQQHLSDLPLLNESEQQQLLVEWNDTKIDYPQDQCIHKLFEAQVEKTPDAIAVGFKNEQLTYAQLNARANQLAHYLQSLEVGSGVLVGICIEPSMEQVLSLLAVLKTNGVYVPLDPNYPQERLTFMLSDSNVRILITQQSLTEKLSVQEAHIVCLDKDTIAKQSVANLDCQTTLDDLAYAIYTSGSTGRPKAVLGKIRGIINRLNWIWSTLPFAADEVAVQKTSINFVDHIAEIFSPLLKGVPLVIVPDDIRSDIPQLMSLLSDKGITRIVLVPSLLKAMLDSAPQQLSQLRGLKYVFCSGEALLLSLAEEFHQKLSSARLFNLYGSSEVAADVTCFEVNFWETRQRILQYFKPEVVRDASEEDVPEVHQKLFTKPGVSSEMLATKFQRSELPLHPLTVDDYYDRFNQEVLPYAVDTGSPTYIGHMTSALPDFMHDMSKMISRLNQNLVKIETSKSLIFLEREALAMLHRLVYGFKSEFYAENIQQKNRNLGIVTTGGTTANISALLCARNSGLLSKENSWELSKESLYKILSKKGYDDIVIIGSRLMHYSFNKAASMLGLGTNNIVFIDSADDDKLDLDLLKEKICECRKNKLYILSLVGIAGTTETGEIDPLSEMGDIAQEFGIHFHVDGAWGGATMFSDKHKGKLKGIDKADSITICGHKQLYLPQGISVCLFKDPQMLNFVATTARYQAQKDTFDVGRFTIEGSRSALSLCLHGALHIIGKRGYEILIDNSIEKAQYFSRLIELLEPFELLMKPALNIVNYRYIPEDLRAKTRQKSLSENDIQRINQLNTQIQKEQFEEGLTFVSKTTIVDKNYEQEIVVFRTVLSNPNTTTTDLQSVLEDQLRLANQIEAKSIPRISSGDTEVAVVHKEAIHLRLKEDSAPDLQEYLQKNTIPIGKPIDNTQIYILDKHGSLLPPGVTGELYVGGDGLAQGYLNMPELTQEKFIPNPFNNGKNNTAEAQRLYRTGDLARWLPDGNIEFVGRIDYQVKIRGFRIELGEIEAFISQHPAVREAVVLVREEASTDSKRLVTYVVSQKEQALTITELREFLASKLPNYMIPNALVTLKVLPLTPNGKVDRKALPIPKQVRPELEAVYLPPQTEVEKTIANIWQEFLRLEEIGIHDNFFELGGHSLLLVQVYSKLQKIFQQLSLVDLFQYPTINYLAKYLTQSQDKQEFVRENTRQNKSRTASINRRKQARQNFRTAKHK